MIRIGRWLYRSLKTVYPLVLAGILTACATVGPEYVTPVPPTLPSEWTPAETEQQGTVVATWWQQFSDPVLTELIDRGAQQNLSIEAAGLRIVQARAALGISDTLHLPQVQQLNGNLTRVYQQEHSFNSAGIGLDVGWEIDIWGKYARGIEVAEAGLYASIASYRNVLVSITAEIARNYINYRTAEERAFLSRQNIAIQQRVLEMTEVQFDAGNVSELDVQQARTQLYTTRASLPTYDIARMQARNALAVLLGTLPAEIAPLLESATPRELPDFNQDIIQTSRVYTSMAAYSEDSIIPTPPAPARQIDPNLVLQRPDLQVAELLTRAQNARIGLAKADLYPQFFLFGSIGMSEVVPAGGSFSASNAVNAAIGPGFQWNIFQYGRIENRVRIEDAAFQESISNYNQSVLRAVQEVSTALESYYYTKQKSEYDFEALEASIRAFNISATQYNNGLVTYQRLLSTVEKMTRREDVYAATRGNMANQVVSLYKALGGGWQSYTELPLVKPETVKVMESRTDWDNTLQPEKITGEDRND